MILALDIGNTQIYGGLFDQGTLKFQFRKSSRQGTSSDEIGIFLKQVLRENGFDPGQVQRIAACTVVPDLVHSTTGACQKYFNQSPFFLKPGVRTGLKVRYHNPVEVGADRIANAIGATKLFPGQNLIIVDFGTATTFCAVSADHDYLGGLIVPGLRLSMEALEAGTAKLPVVEILRAKELVARSTVESIQSGLYFGNLEMTRALGERIRREAFGGDQALLIGTGGFARLFQEEKLFDHFVPDLVLTGLKIALELNASEPGTGEAG